MELKLKENWDSFAKAAKERENGIILFGASSAAEKFLSKLKENFPIKYIIDNDTKKHGQRLVAGKNIQIFPPEKLIESNVDDIILITSTYYDEIIEQMQQLSIKGNVYSYLHLTNKVTLSEKFAMMEKKIPLVKELLADEKSKEVLDKIAYKRKNEIKDYSDIYEGNQYFVSGIMEPNESEVFVDGGAYDGDTIRDMIVFENNKFSKAYAFEMDRSNFEKIPREDFDERIIFCNYGLWDVNQKISFIGDGTASEIAEMGSETAECIALDEFIKDHVTFIKMDVEGAEQKALKGAENIIKKDKPKLAICLYHKLEDFWEIPFYIHELVPEYKIYIRHHAKDWHETVMYAHL